MATSEDLRECLRARTLAAVADSVRFTGRYEKNSEMERKGVIHATYTIMRKSLGEEFLDRYLGEDMQLPFDEKELQRVKKLCKLLDMHSFDPCIQSIQRRYPDFTYRNGPKRLNCPLPNGETVKSGWYCLGMNTELTLRVFIAGELYFIGELPKTDKLYQVYYGLPRQVFTKNKRGGVPLAHSWDCEKALRFHIKRARKIQEQQ